MYRQINTQNNPVLGPHGEATYNVFPVMRYLQVKTFLVKWLARAGDKWDFFRRVLSSNSLSLMHPKMKAKTEKNSDRKRTNAHI